MSLLDALFRGGHLRAIDHALALSLRRLDPATPDAVLAAAALASLAVANGHAAFDLARPTLLVDDATLAWPDASAWHAALHASRWVATPAQDTVADASCPLVLEDTRLALRRYREYERRLAAGLLRLASTTPVDSAALDSAAVDTPARQDAAPPALFDALFPDARGGLDDIADASGDQARAAVRALSTALLLVTGGPGTGKTTTIARVLLLLIAQARGVEAASADARSGTATASLRIALAAPTGRAAERMASSLRAIAAVLRDTPGVDAALCDALPLEARTLHRLLGSIPDSPRFRHDARDPLPFDVVVVDEASMVDLPLMCKLVEAVPHGARLILLGDRDQLPSVEAGDVLAAIGDAMGETAPPPPHMRSGGGSGELLPDSDDTGRPPSPDGIAAAAAAARTMAAATERHPLAGHRVHLRRGYRQSAALQLAPLADAVRDGDAPRALALLRDGALAGVHFHEDLLDPLHGPTRERLLAPWRALQDCDDPALALQLAGRTRLLTALRDGPQGARQLNARIEEALAGSHRAPYFHGRLLLVTENSTRHGLFNGDIGVCLRSGVDGGGRDGDRRDPATLAWFAGDGRGPRHLHPSALPAHEGAFAMTVHKAQGSEFDDAWLLLPAHDARPLSRELVYTALTRARASVQLCAGAAVLRAALSRHAQRVSGLAARLGGSA